MVEYKPIDLPEPLEGRIHRFLSDGEIGEISSHYLDLFGMACFKLLQWFVLACQQDDIM